MAVSSLGSVNREVTDVENSAPSSTTAYSSVDPTVGDDVCVNRALGIILAGTHEWGACALERITPRPLVPILNKPLVSHALSWLSNGGVRSAAICANGQTGALRRELSRNPVEQIDIEYFEDHAPRGPAGCIRDAARDEGHDLFVVLEGTVVPQIDLDAALTRHVQSGAAMTMVVMHDGHGSETPSRPVGIYILSREALKYIPAKGYQDLKERFIPALHQAGQCVMTLTANMEAPRVTAADAYLGVNDWMMQHAMSSSADFSDYRRVGESLIHPTAVVDDSALLMGPVLVGPGTTIGRDVTVVGPTSIGAGCEIRSGAVVTRSSIWDDCLLESGTVIDRCIMATGSKADQERSYRHLVFSAASDRSAKGVGMIRRFRDRLIGRKTSC
jgi:NDP-sugar pyrophosphorylase family protein